MKLIKIVICFLIIIVGCTKNNSSKLEKVEEEPVIFDIVPISKKENIIFTGREIYSQIMQNSKVKKIKLSPMIPPVKLDSNKFLSFDGSNQIIITKSDSGLNFEKVKTKLPDEYGMMNIDSSGNIYLISGFGIYVSHDQCKNWLKEAKDFNITTLHNYKKYLFATALPANIYIYRKEKTNLIKIKSIQLPQIVKSTIIKKNILYYILNNGNVVQLDMNTRKMSQVGNITFTKKGRYKSNYISKAYITSRNRILLGANFSIFYADSILGKFSKTNIQEKVEISCFAENPSGILFAGTYEGDILMSSDSGETWKIIDSAQNN